MRRRGACGIGEREGIDEGDVPAQRSATQMIPRVTQWHSGSRLQASSRLKKRVTSEKRSWGQDHIQVNAWTRHTGTCGSR